MPFNTQKANQIHNKYYDYSKVVYVDVYTKVEIICPVHGSFWQTPKNHIYLKAGCKQCSIDRSRGTFDINAAKLIHSDKYVYSKVNYANIDTKVEIICPVHGSFWQTPYRHINKGFGCVLCKGDKISVSKHHGVDRFLSDAKAVHGDRFDYSCVVYKNSHIKVEIKCTKHGSFLQTPTNHIDGKNGCPTCSTNVSASGEAWLNSFHDNDIEREKIIYINNKKYKVDGYNTSTNTIYEYFGVFWHGCPSYTDHTKINPRNGVPFKHLYESTIKRINTFNGAGYKLIYKWGK